MNLKLNSSYTTTLPKYTYNSRLYLHNALKQIKLFEIETIELHHLIIT